MGAEPRYVRVIDQQGLPIPLKVRRCGAFLCRLRGLMFRRSLPADEGLLFIERGQSRLGAAIHMLFVFFPIAVVWLSAESVVVDAVLAKPFHLFYAPRVPASRYLEGPPALLSWVHIGERLSID